MPLKLRFGKAKKYDVSSKNAYLVCVRLLDNSLMECTLTSDSTGQECLENIAQRIQLSQTDYFGLGYVNKKLHFRWLDLQRPIKKQLDKYSSTPLIYFGVMFYIPLVHKVKDSMIRYLFYLQLKSDIIEGKLPCSQGQAVMLAAYSVQAEFGNFDSSRHNVDFYKGYVLLPKHKFKILLTINVKTETLALDESACHELNQEMCSQHHKLQGLPPQDAELQYIVEAQQLKDYGSEYYPAKDEKSHDIHLGVSFQGVLLKTLNGLSEQFFKWVDIKKVVHSKKTLGFEIYVPPKASQLDSSAQPKRVHCNFEGLETAKYVFKMSSLQHQFYHLMQGNQIGKESPEDSPVITVDAPLDIKPEAERISGTQGLEVSGQDKVLTQFHSTDPETSNTSLQVSSPDSSTMSDSYTETAAPIPYDTGQQTQYVTTAASQNHTGPQTDNLPQIQQPTEEATVPGLEVTAIQYMTENYAALHAQVQEQQQQSSEKVNGDISQASENIDPSQTIVAGAGYGNTHMEEFTVASATVSTDNRPHSAIYEPQHHAPVQAVASDASSGAVGNGYLATTAVGQVPDYRAVPDYQTVMQQRALFLQQQQQQQQNLESMQTNMLHSSGNLGHGGQVTYSQPDNVMSYAPQPHPSAADLVGRTPPTYQQYLTQPPRTSMVGGSTGLQYSRSFLETNPLNSTHGQPHIRMPGQYGKPVDRHNSLIIHPTYTTHRDVYFPKPSNQLSNSEIILREYIANRTRPANPYRLGSSSTPDLASQNMTLNLSSSPDLKYVSNGNLVNQSQLDQSVENLALDAARLQIHQHLATKSKQQLAEEQSSSEQIAYSDGLAYNQHVMLQSQDSLNQQQSHQPAPLPTSQQYLTEQHSQAYNVYGPGYRHEGMADEQEVFINAPPHVANNHSPPNYHSMLVTPFAPNQMFYTGNAVDLINQKPKPKEHIYQNLPLTGQHSNNKNEYGDENPYENLPSALIGLQDENLHTNTLSGSSGNSFDNNGGNSSKPAEERENNPTSSSIIHSDNNSTIALKQKTSLSTPIPTMDADALEHIKSPSFRGAYSGQQTEGESVAEVSHTEPAGNSTETVPGLVKGGLVDQLVSGSSHYFHNGELQSKANGTVMNGQQGRLPLESSSSSSTKEQRDSTATEYEDSEESPKNLRKAALSGLSLSRADMIEMNDNEQRAPKDDRRRALETKLEEGQVFAEFEDIPKMKSKCDCTVASQEENKDKNRFKDVLPYDSNRVQLTPRKENKAGYINASHIKITLAKQEFCYIAAQGPKPNTVVDFWQMMWEQEVRVIAMLTDLIELGKEKCHRYWPEEEGPKKSIKYGDYQVTLKFTNDSGGFITRALILRHCKLKRERFLWHLQYPDWQDHGCPDDTYGFLAYLDEIESVRRHARLENHDDHKTPVLVHCSAGVGRSGVVILAEVMKACLEHNQDLEIATVLSRMRLERMYLVQTVSQYSFVYKTLVTYLKSSRLI